MDSQIPGIYKLPPPNKTGGLPIMAALAKRRSMREFSSRELPQRVVSDILWAANGINRPDSSARTAPSARNWKEIDVYAALPDDLYLYDPDVHALNHVLSHDVRAATGAQDFVATAPLDLVYVADLTRIDVKDPVERRFYCAADAAFMAQNVYLFCASEGLATVVRGAINRHALAVEMRLSRQQRVILAQTVGYPSGRTA